MRVENTSHKKGEQYISSKALNYLFDSIFFPVSPVGEGYDFPQKTDTGGLNPKDHEEYGQ